MRKINFIVFSLFFSSVLHFQSDAQVSTTYSYGLIPLDTTGYRIWNDSLSIKPYLVPVCGLYESIKCDLKYATKDNFTGVVLYPSSEAFLTRDASYALIKVAQELEKSGYGLLIGDAYRPYSVTVRFWEMIGNEEYVAHPSKGSRHNRGCAVDVALYDLNSKQIVDLPTPFDHFGPEASASALCSSELKCKNRDLLISAMHRHGFNVLASEWWHFDYTGWEKLPVLDVPLDWLLRQ